MRAKHIKEISNITTIPCVCLFGDAMNNMFGLLKNDLTNLLFSYCECEQKKKKKKNMF